MTLSPHLRKKKKKKKGSKSKHLVVLTTITFHPCAGLTGISYTCLRNDTFTRHEGQAQKQNFRDLLDHIPVLETKMKENQRCQTKPSALVWMRKVTDKNSQNLP